MGTLVAQTTEHEPYGKTLNRQGRRVLTAGADGLLYEMYSLDEKLLGCASRTFTRAAFCWRRGGR